MNQPGSHRVRACTTARPISAVTTIRPPSAAGRASAAAAHQRRRVSSAARRSARPRSAQVSSNRTAPYPPSASGSAPGVATTSAGVAVTLASTPSRPDVRTVMPGNARPSSSAVRRSPTTVARNRVSPQDGHRHPAAPAGGWLERSTAGRPHQVQAGGPAPLGRPSEPWQWPHRAGRRQPAQASESWYPRRGTWTSTGVPAASASWAARQARDGSRAARAAGSLASSKSEPVASTRAAAARTIGRGGVSAPAQPTLTSACASADGDHPPMSRPDRCCRERNTATSRVCG